MQINAAGRPTLAPKSSLVAIILREFRFTFRRGDARTDVAPDRYLDVTFPFQITALTPWMRLHMKNHVISVEVGVLSRTRSANRNNMKEPAQTKDIMASALVIVDASS